MNCFIPLTRLLALSLLTSAFALSAADPSADIDASARALRSPADAARVAAIKHLAQYSSGIKPLVQSLILALSDKSIDVRSTAARALAEIGPSARDAAPALIPLLNDKDENTRGYAALALAEIGAPSDEALCNMAFLLQSGNPYVRGCAAQSLGKFGMAAAAHRPALFELLNDSSVETAINAAIALATTGEPAPAGAGLYVLALARPGDVHKIADGALRAIGAPAVAALQAVLHETGKDMYSRREAAAMLGTLGELARPAIPDLRGALSDADLEVQNRAAMALIELGAAPIEASAALIRVARDYPDWREKVLSAFAKMDEHAADYPLAMMAGKDDVASRREAARVLSGLAPRFKANLDPLLAFANDPDDGIRFLILEALSRSGADAKRLVKPAAALLNDKNYNVATLALTMLSAMKAEPAAMLALADARVHETNQTLRGEAGKVVIAAGADAIAVLPLLRDALKSDDVMLRDWALQIIGNLGPQASDAVPDVVECLVKFTSYRAEAARALGKLGEKAVEPLIALLNATDPNIRSNASTALSLIGAPAVPKLTAFLSDNNPDAVEAALVALEHAAPASAPAIPELIRAANSKLNRISNAASQVLSKLGPLAAPALIEEIKKNDESARRIAANALGQANAKSVPFIVDALRAEQDPAIVCTLMDVLGRMGPPAADGVPAILEAASRPYGPKDRGTVWSRCANALGNIGAARGTAVPVLFDMLASPEKTSYGEAANSLRKIGGEDLPVPPLADVLQNAQTAYMGNALRSFGRTAWVQLAAELESGSAEIRDASARAFGQLAPECVPFLLRELDDHSSAAVGVILAIGEIRAVEMDMEKRANKQNAKAFEEFQKAMDACTPALQKRIQGANPNEALAAIWAMGKQSTAGLDLAVKVFAAAAPDLHPRGIAALGYYDLHGQSRALVPVLPIILAETGSASGLVRRQALALLQSAGYCAESVPALAAAMEDANPSVRDTAGTALKGLGPDARASVPKLIEILDAGTPALVNGIPQILIAIGSDSVPDLVKAMRAEGARLRGYANNTLSMFKPAVLAPHVKLFAEAAADGREDVAARALQFIASFKDAGRPAEASLRALLSRDDDVVFHESVRALAAMGANVFAALEPIAENPNEDIAIRAVREMQSAAGDPGAVTAFVRKALKNENPKIRAAAVHLLPGKEAGAPNSMPIAALALNDPVVTVRTSAAVWLFDNAPFKPDASLPLLLTGLKDAGESVAAVSRRALIAMGVKALPIVPEVKKLLADPRRETQANAARVIVKLGIEDDPLATMIYNETNIYEKLGEYHDKQEQFFEEHWIEGNAHIYAATFLETWGPTAKDYVDHVDPDGVFNLTGYKLKVITGQTARAEGGKKEWLKKGALTDGHAAIAWPVQPGVSGRVAYMAGPDGAIYERAMTAEDAARINEWAAAFDPGPEWTKIFAPEKIVQRPAPHDYYKPKAQAADQMEF